MDSSGLDLKRRDTQGQSVGDCSVLPFPSSQTQTRSQ